MISYPRHIIQSFIFILVVTFLLAACSISKAAPTATQPLPPSTSTATLLPPTATPTPIPLAAVVNGEDILLSDYQAELARYQSALNSNLATPAPGTNLATQDKQRVMDDLINQTLLAQGAVQEGFKSDEASVQARLDNLTGQIGGAQALSKWETAHGYTDDSFRQALKRAIASAWMRDQIVSGVPEFVDQVHARQILLYNESDANQVLSRIEAGAKFATLAENYDPVTGGDLGWFPQGYLTEPVLEQAAFSLKPGEHSEVIHTRLGYHILEVIERDAHHSLDPDARLALQTQAVEQWLSKRRSQSEIKIIAQ